jgi:hypothetical protein
VPSLAPQESTDFIGNYTVTQADVDAGGLSNTAVATGFTGDCGAEAAHAFEFKLQHVCLLRGHGSRMNPTPRET